MSYHAWPPALNALRGMRRQRRTDHEGTWQEYEQAYHEMVAGKAVPGLRGRWLAQDVNDPDGGFSVSVWDSLDAMQAYEQSAVFTQEIQPRLQPFFAGEYTTYRCDVKYEQ